MIVPPAEDVDLLLFRDATGRDGFVALGADELVIGRAAECGLQADDVTVARRHAVVRREDGRYWIVDLDSPQGIYVEERRTRRHCLTHNDVVRCGGLWLRFWEKGHRGP